jgi:para-aminobenzoate synthetase component 1
LKNDFPYKLLKRNEIISLINKLAHLNEPFLFIIDYEAENGYVIAANIIDYQHIKFSLPNKHSESSTKENVEIHWKTFPISFQEYTSKFSYVREQIQQGNSFLVNLTQPTRVETNCTLEEIYDKCSAKYKLWLNNQFVVLSPESFVQISDGKIASFPMKGTINAKISNAENTILNDAKEKAEHATIVDLIRNDLSIVSDNVHVKRYRYIEKLQTNKGELLQVSSEIVGTLPTDYKTKLGELLLSLLPAGSISGAPKPKTVEIIKKAESYNRGFYTGIFGFFDGKTVDSAVMIRFIEQQENAFVFKSGGGITSQSDVQKEYEELIQKVYVPIN